MRELRQQPSDSRRKGLPPIGFALRAPEQVTVETEGGVVCREVDPDGRVIGELGIVVFGAGLIIDRDGVLERIASEAAEDAAEAGGRVEAVMSVTLDSGISGYRAEIETAGAALPHQTILALASRDLAVCGGVLVTIRAADARWPAGEAMVDSLRVLTRDGAENDQAVRLPIVGRR